VGTAELGISPTRRMLPDGAADPLDTALA
jgi:hypothetical protein